MLTDGFDEIEAEPFASGGFAELYRATYKGQPVVAKALKTTSVNDLENMHRVSGLISCRTIQLAYTRSPALCERGCRMEVAEAREHSSIRWRQFEPFVPFNGFRLDGEWRYYEFYQGHPKSESIQSRGYIQFWFRNH